MERVDRLRADNKKSFAKMLSQFCEATNWGNAEELTEILYGKFLVEDFLYSDEWRWFSTENYLKTTVVPHKIAVFEAGFELNKKLPNSARFDELEFVDNLWLHDLSKFSFVEAFGYSGWDFKTKSGDKAAFDAAWNHHKHHNPHHPENWLSVGRFGDVTVLPMPKIYVAEMVADWIGAGKTYGNSLENWLPDNLSSFKLHQDSAVFLHEILDAIEIKTKFVGGVLHTF